MANVLSQEEIDALLGGISEGTVPVETAAASENSEPGKKDILSFDFTDQDHVLRGRLPTLEIVHDRFARLLRIGKPGYRVDDLERKLETSGPQGVVGNGAVERNGYAELPVGRNRELGTGAVFDDPRKSRKICGAGCGIGSGD